jgi:hypothetical protein
MTAATTSIFDPIIQAVIAAIALALTTLIGIYVPKGIAAFEKRTGVDLTTQQTAGVMQAAQTGAGILETQLAQGAIKLEHLTPTNPVVVEQAQKAIARVPVYAAAIDKTVPSMAETIVGLVSASPVIKAAAVAATAPSTILQPGATV